MTGQSSRIAPSRARGQLDLLQMPIRLPPNSIDQSNSSLDVEAPSCTYQRRPAPEIHATAVWPQCHPYAMDEEPELDVTEFSDDLSVLDYRERIARARHEARRRYRDYLAAVFERHGVADSGEFADAALDALTVWRYVDSGERCRCSCHPQLPETDLHDYGFDCLCARHPEDRRRAFQRWLDDIQAFWQSPDGQQIKAAEQADDAELQAWLAGQQGVSVHSHGGLCPEQWTGEVDGHSFYFRERHAEWRIELDLRPSGRFIRTVAGTDNDGAPDYKERELDEGEMIACGTIDIEEYGITPVQRAQFIIDTIRIHLTRQTCTHHHDDQSSIKAILGAKARWCPACGTRLNAP